MVEHTAEPTRPVGRAAAANPLQAILDKQLLKQCVHCGLCLDACPTYRLLGNEADSPRGRIYQVRQVYEGRISAEDPDFREHIYACLACRACETACPSGVRYGTIVEAARAVAPPPSAAERWLGRAIMRTLFASPLVMEAVGLGLRTYQKSGLQGLVRRSGILQRLPGGLADMEQMLPAAQGGLRHWSPPPVTRPAGPVRHRVGFIAGCIMPQLFGDTNAATVRVLAINGCEVFAPPTQGCCGALHVHSGDREMARELARRNIDAFGSLGLDAIIINAAGCGSTLKEYGHLLADDPAYALKARSFSAIVRDVSEFLASIDLVPPTHAVPLRVTYQDACHLIHGQGIRHQPRQLLRAIPGLELVEMKDSDVCCGSAGIYNITHPDLSRRVLEEKMVHVAATEASAIVAPNPGCAVQLASGARQRGMEVSHYHVVDLLDRAYGAAEPGETT